MQAGLYPFRSNVVGINAVSLLRGLIASCLVLAGSAVFSVSLQSEERRVAPDSHWWIDDQGCSIRGYWGNPEAEITILMIAPVMGGGYRLDISNNRWRDLPVDAPMAAGFGFDGAARVTESEALGYSVEEWQGFGLLVEPVLIDGLDDHRVLEIYRGRDLLSSLELDRAGEAVEAMNACLAAWESDAALANASMADDMSADREAAIDALEAAAAAAEEQARPESR